MGKFFIISSSNPFCKDIFLTDIGIIERKGSITADVKKLKNEYPEIFEAVKVEKKGYSYIQIK